MTHIDPPFAIQDQQLAFNGRPVREFAAQARGAPFYVYDRSVIEARIAALRNTLPDAIAIHYAVKANPNHDLLSHLAPLVDGLDIASAGELSRLLAAGISPAGASFAGPGKGDAELAAAIRADVVINVESGGELERLVAIAEDIGLEPRVALRVNPDFELKTSGMKMAGGAKPFGIDTEQLPALLDWLPELPVNFHGLHIFPGSQNLNTAALIEAHSAMLSLATTLADASPLPVRQVTLGAGFGIPYFPGDKPFDLDAVAANLRSALAAFHARHAHTRVALEMGRYLVGEAGAYICTVVDRKVSRGKTYLVTNGGMHHHLAVSGNLGQVIRKNYPVVVADRVTASDTETVTVVGPLCTPLDILADNVELPRCEPGSLIAILQSGAYGLTASPINFLSMPPAREFLA